jgi:hypothetical protein
MMKSIDILVLNEYMGDPEDLLTTLQTKVTDAYFQPKPANQKRFYCFCKKTEFDCSEIHSGKRTSYRRLVINEVSFVLGFFHGLDLRNYDSENRQSYIQTVSNEMKFVRKEHGVDRLIMIGDFNMNPYDRAMNIPAGMNAMSTRVCTKPTVRQFLGVDYDLFYNPMWSLLGDKSVGPAGTIYDTSGQGQYGWSMFDQVIIHATAVSFFKDVEIVTVAGSESLSDSLGRPDASNSSDHFPILLTLTGGNCEHVLA